jgi:hypothetical protein
MRSYPEMNIWQPPLTPRPKGRACNGGSLAHARARWGGRSNPGILTAVTNLAAIVIAALRTLRGERDQGPYVSPPLPDRRGSIAKTILAGVRHHFSRPHARKAIVGFRLTDLSFLANLAFSRIGH